MADLSVLLSIGIFFRSELLLFCSPSGESTDFCFSWPNLTYLHFPCEPCYLISQVHVNVPQIHLYLYACLSYACHCELAFKTSSCLCSTEAEGET